MKKLLIGLLVLTSLSAFAKSEAFDLSYQKANILGAWEGKNDVFLIQLQDEDSIKIFRCNRATYLADNHCSYNRVIVGNYNRHFDGFCIPWDGRSCPTGFQVSQQTSNEMMEIADPLHIYDASGRVHHLKKNQ